MITEHPSQEKRALRTVELEADLIVVGGGLAGTCCAITAAREGVRVILVQDRPMLGGNASSEVRLWILGATSHMGNNNRWSREGGVVNEILEENLRRNREGNAHILDTILLEKCFGEPNLTLLLDTAIHDLEKKDPDTISALHGFCSQNSTRYLLRAQYFTDSSGDGIVGFLAGAAFRMGGECRDEFGEAFAPDAEYGRLLGHSMYFYSKDAGIPVKYIPPSWALQDITRIPRYRQFRANMQGCNFWWLEYGGRLDTIHDTQEIKRELWKIIYGVWDHIKNSGEFPQAETLTLEWVGQIPGKRESRRFEGDYLLNQQDLVGRRVFDDVVSHGGWAIDLHPADGVYSELPGCTQWHSKGVYGIPYRCYHSRNIRNLFLAGRVISVTHVAFGSTRVIATCAAGGQAVGMAAALCLERNCMPADLQDPLLMETLQCRLQRSGQFLPNKVLADPADLAESAAATASSSYRLSRFEPAGTSVTLDHGWAMLLPLLAGTRPTITLRIEAVADTLFAIELWTTSRPAEFTMHEKIAAAAFPLATGEQTLAVPFDIALPADAYYFIKLPENPLVRVTLSEDRVTGVLATTAAYNKAVATSSLQNPPSHIGMDAFEFWLPKRRPEGRNFAMELEPAVDCFSPANVIQGPARPTNLPNAWVADPADPLPHLWLDWPTPRTISKILIEFDADWDHPMESVLMTHPEEVVPFMVRDFDLTDEGGAVLHEVRGHGAARFEWTAPEPLSTRRIGLRILSTHGSPASVFRVRCY